MFIVLSSLLLLLLLGTHERRNTVYVSNQLCKRLHGNSFLFVDFNTNLV